jgi:glycosyltransferase involved in cell wall biosynthesis
VMSPLVIPFKQNWRLVRALNQGCLGWQIRLFMRLHGFNAPLLWSYHPYMLGATSLFAHGPIVYHCVDDLAAIPGIDSLAFNDAERLLLGRCQAAFVTSEALMVKCQPFNINTHYLPNVVDAEHFGSALKPGVVPDDLQSIPSPRVGYIGALSDFKIDFKLVCTLARRRPEWSWVFIGKEREGQNSQLVRDLRALPNVYFLGDRAYEQLPAYLRGLDVGILPSLINAYTHAMFPMKYFEYLAAGLPVVSTRLAFTDSNSGGMIVCDTVEEFEFGIAAQLARGKYTSCEADMFVGDNTWHARLSKMLDLIPGYA